MDDEIRVLVVDRNAEAIRERLEAAGAGVTVAAATVPGTASIDDAQGIDAYVGMRPSFSIAGTGVRWVHSTGAGVDAWLAGDPWPEGVRLTRTLGQMGARIGEYCVARALAATQRLFELREDQSQARWDPVEAREIRGTSALVIGTGSIGGGIGAAFRALGCDVTGLSRSGTPRDAFHRVETADRLGALVAEADWIVLAAPATDASRHLVDRAVLDACRGAYLINVGRGSLVDEDALVDALRDGRLSGAALDVFATEPLPADSPLWREPGVLISPHVAALTHPAEAADAFLEALSDLRAGREPSTSVDPARGY